jgi:dihydroneopterin triphosphate diphosphatase
MKRPGTEAQQSDGVRVVVRVVDVYAYRFRAEGTPEFLLLHRAPGQRYAGAWRMVGGKIEQGESAWQAGLRETEEELGLRPVRFWSLPSVNMFYDWANDRVQLAPAFAAEMTGEPTLNAEHDGYRWLAAREAVQMLQWSEQRRLLALSEEVLQAGGPAAELVIF